MISVSDTGRRFSYLYYYTERERQAAQRYSMTSNQRSEVNPNRRVSAAIGTFSHWDDHSDETEQKSSGGWRTLQSGLTEVLEGSDLLGREIKSALCVLDRT